MDLRPGTSKTVHPLDSNFESTILRWHNEEGSEGSDMEDGDDLEEHEYRLSSESGDDDEQSLSNDENIDEEASEEADQDNDNGIEKKYFYGKDRQKWAVNEPVRNVRTPQHNIVVTLPGLKGPARTLGDRANPEDIWNLLISEAMINTIVQYTNIKIAEIRTRYAEETRTDLKNTDSIEIRALMGLLIYTAIYKSNDEDIDAMFTADGTGREIFRTIMSGKRFSVLINCLRFDDTTTRKERLKEQPAAHIHNIFEMFFENCQNVFTIGKNACIDEMLIGFRGRCKFRMYIPNKPRKYGIKLMLLTDAKTQFAYNSYIYTGKGSDGIGLSNAEKNLTKPTQSVIRLSKPLFGTNRNITADNWFSSLQLVKELQSRGLTYVGTMRKSKREIPPEFKASRQKQVGSALYGFSKHETLVSYIPKKNKAVILISSMHHSRSTDVESNKPEIISFYNSTKGGVDALDEKCTIYSSSRRTRRWPMAIFYQILDMSCVNAFVMHNCFKNNENTSRIKFMKALAKSLTEPFMRRRFENPRINLDIRNSIKRILALEEPVPFEAEEKLEVRKYCYLCPSKLHRKTFYLCCDCKKPICLSCSKKICTQCASK